MGRDAVPPLAGRRSPRMTQPGQDEQADQPIEDNDCDAAFVLQHTDGQRQFHQEQACDKKGDHRDILPPEAQAWSRSANSRRAPLRRFGFGRWWFAQLCGRKQKDGPVGRVLDWAAVRL